MKISTLLGPDVTIQLKQSLSPKSLKLIKKARELASQNGWNLYLVGGVVRDILLGQANYDLDLVVEGDAAKLAQSLKETLGGRILIHRRFGTAKLHTDDMVIDLAMSRAESYDYPGALPTVRPGSIDDDLKRRDFTINAMALRLDPGSRGKLIDPFGGQKDLHDRLIRILHDGSFVDDATRMLRAVRYEQRFGFHLETLTESLLRQNVSMMHTISGDRIRHELELILKEEYPEKVLQRAGELGLLGEVHPALKCNGWLKSRFRKVREVAPSEAQALYLILLTYRLSTEERKNFIARLKIPAKLSRPILDTARLREELPALDSPDLSPGTACRLLRTHTPSSVLACAIAEKSTTRRKILLAYLTEWRHVTTSLDGHTLQKIGIQSGPQLGEILEALLEAKLDGRIKSKRGEIEFVRRWLSREKR